MQTNNYDKLVEDFMSSRSLHELRQLREATKAGDGNGVPATFRGEDLRVTDEMAEDYLRAAESKEAEDELRRVHARDEAAIRAAERKANQSKPSWWVSMVRRFKKKQ